MRVVRIIGSGKNVVKIIRVLRRTHLCQWPVGGVVLGVLGAARGLAHLPIPLGALMLLRLSPLSLQMAAANQIKTKLN